MMINKKTRILLRIVSYITLFLVGFFFCPWIFAQSSLASMTIQDTGGQTWTNGTVTYIFQGNGSFNGVYQWNGADLPAQYLTPQTINLNDAGGGEFTVPSSGAITPAGSSWRVTVCPNATSSCITNNIPINGATPDISGSINPTLAPLSVVSAPLPLAYGNSEVKTSIRTGALYYDTTNAIPKYYDGSIWHTLATGSLAGAVLLAPTTTQNIVQPSGTAFGVTGPSFFSSTNAPINNPATILGDTNGQSFYNTWNIPTLGNANTSQNQIGTQHTCVFNSPGWNIGTSDATSTALWSVQQCVGISAVFNTPGIGQPLLVNSDKYSLGDTGNYLYLSSDGGNNDGGHEGVVGLALHGGQHSTWFQGSVAAGATTGTQTLPVAYNAGTYSRTAVSIGGTMLDTTQRITTGHFNGANIAIAGVTGLMAIPIDTTVTPTTAYGTLTADLAQSPSPIAYKVSTQNINILGGTTSIFTTGLAWIAGDDNFVPVNITVVGSVTGGVQSITFSYLNPTPIANATIWQGGTQGFISLDYFNNLMGGSSWRTAYPVFGATDSTHIVAGLLSVNSWKPVNTNINTTQTYQIPLVNLVGNGTTVTASFASPYQVSTLFNQSSVTIAGTSGMDGTGTSTKINPAGISWTQAISGTSSTGNISLSQNYFTFEIFPGAIVTQPQNIANLNVPLDYNNVAWTSGDLLENPFNPWFEGSAETTDNFVGSPDSRPGGGTLSMVSQGMGVSNSYAPIQFINGNPESMYQGGGGNLPLRPQYSVIGANNGFLDLNQWPLLNGTVFSLGCPSAAQGGCGTSNPGVLFYLGNSSGLSSDGAILWHFDTATLDLPGLNVRNLTTLHNMNYTGYLHQNGIAAAVAIVGTPTIGTTPCTVPQVEYDDTSIYTCYATNTWSVTRYTGSSTAVDYYWSDSVSCTTGTGQPVQCSATTTLPGPMPDASWQLLCTADAGAQVADFLCSPHAFPLPTTTGASLSYSVVQVMQNGGGGGTPTVYFHAHHN